MENRSLRLSQSASLVSNNLGKRCGECETFTKCRSGFCPKIEIEVSKNHPACQMFVNIPILGDWRGKTAEPHDGLPTSNNHNLGHHLKAYTDYTTCSGPNPEYCTVYCSKYWNCQLVLDEIRKE